MWKHFWSVLILVVTGRVIGLRPQLESTAESTVTILLYNSGEHKALNASVLLQ